jgi:hypothetical protein
MGKNTFINGKQQENSERLTGLAFYKDDLRFLAFKHSERSTKNANKTDLLEIAHYKNQFIIQRNNIDELIYLVKTDEKRLVDWIEDSLLPKKTHQNFEQEQLDSFKKTFVKLRSDYFCFLAKSL